MEGGSPDPLLGLLTLIERPRSRLGSPALDPPVGPALAHAQSPADLIQGEQLRDTAIGTFDNIPALSSRWISNPSSSRPHSPSSPLQSTSSQTQGTSSRLEVESSVEQVPPQG
jgi:hypothetical protein